MEILKKIMNNLKNIICLIILFSGGLAISSCSHSPIINHSHILCDTITMPCYTVALYEKDNITGIIKSYFGIVFTDDTIKSKMFDSLITIPHSETIFLDSATFQHVKENIDAALISNSYIYYAVQSYYTPCGEEWKDKMLYKISVPWKCPIYLPSTYTVYDTITKRGNISKTTYKGFWFVASSFYNYLSSVGIDTNSRFIYIPHAKVPPHYLEVSPIKKSLKNDGYYVFVPYTTLSSFYCDSAEVEIVK